MVFGLKWVAILVEGLEMTHFDMLSRGLAQGPLLDAETFAIYEQNCARVAVAILRVDLCSI